MDEESQHLDRLLTSLHGECSRRHTTAFGLWRTAPNEGADLMIVSRGPGSGLSEFVLPDASSTATRARIIAAAAGEAAQVPGGGATRRLARQAVSLLFPDGDAPWQSRAVFTSLYRAALADGRLPPSVQQAQRRHCTELLRFELLRHRPRRMFVLSGWDAFAPFAERLDLTIAAEPSDVIEVVGRAGGTLVIVVNGSRELSETEATEALRSCLIPGTDQMSAAQQRQFETVAGYPWDGSSLRGGFMTDCPNSDRSSKSSPWSFRFLLRPEAGHLFLELEHRMTNNRTSGYDRNGNKLPAKIVDEVFPPHT